MCWRDKTWWVTSLDENYNAVIGTSLSSSSKELSFLLPIFTFNTTSPHLVAWQPELYSLYITMLLVNPMSSLYYQWSSHMRLALEQDKNWALCHHSSILNLVFNVIAGIFFFQLLSAFNSIRTGQKAGALRRAPTKLNIKSQVTIHKA